MVLIGTFRVATYTHPYMHPNPIGLSLRQRGGRRTRPVHKLPQEETLIRLELYLYMYAYRRGTEKG